MYFAERKSDSRACPPGTRGIVRAELDTVTQRDTDTGQPAIHEDAPPLSCASRSVRSRPSGEMNGRNRLSFRSRRAEGRRRMSSRARGYRGLSHEPGAAAGHFIERRAETAAKVGSEARRTRGSLRSFCRAPIPVEGSPRSDSAPSGVIRRKARVGGRPCPASPTRPVRRRPRGGRVARPGRSPEGRLHERAHRPAGGAFVPGQAPRGGARPRESARCKSPRRSRWARRPASTRARSSGGRWTATSVAAP